MTKFCCEHCGRRIAIQPRHLGRLVTCPECGNRTHPLAGQIVSLHGGTTPPRTMPDARSRRGSPATVAATQTPAACANCGRAMGRLEKVNLWENHVVCTPCRGALAGAAAPSSRCVVVEPAPIVRSPSASYLDAGPLAAARHRSPIVLSARGRLTATLIALCVAGAAIYGALSLLRELAGLLTVVAFILLALLGIFLLLRALPLKPNPGGGSHRIIDRRLP